MAMNVTTKEKVCRELAETMNSTINKVLAEWLALVLSNSRHEHGIDR